MRGKKNRIIITILTVVLMIAALSLLNFIHLPVWMLDYYSEIRYTIITIGVIAIAFINSKKLWNKSDY